MKKITGLAWTLLCVIILFSSCRKEVIDPVTTEKIPEPVELVQASLKGQVIDEDNQPIQGALIEVESYTTTTDEHGMFFVKDQDFNANGTLVTAKKSSFFLGAKLFNPSVGTESYVLIQLLTKEVDGNFTTSTGGTITTSDNASVSFSANSIMYENGTSYTGEVSVSMKYIDPTHELLTERMPGDLRAVNLEDELVQLATYGMLAVELEAPNGTSLQIKTGLTATITLPLPAELNGTAPGTIPLWSFNEDTGYWEEESTASLVDGKYVGEVSHFSFWNCDAPFPVVPLEGSVTDANGNPIENVKVSITIDGAVTRNGWTNSDGVYAGKVPENQDLLLEVFNQCNSVVATINIAPLSAAHVVDPIVIDPADLVEIKGNLVKCDGSPVTNGYGFTTGGIGYSILDIDDTGAFSRVMFLCEDTDVSIKGYDLDVPLTTDAVTMPITTGTTVVDFGDLEVCETVEEGIIVSLPDFSYEKEHIIYYASASPNSTNSLQISVSYDSIYFELYAFEITEGQTGLVDVGYATYTDGFDTTIGNYYFSCQEICGQLNITQNDGPGGTFVATYSHVVDGYDNTGMTSTYLMEVDINVILE